MISYSNIFSDIDSSSELVASLVKKHHVKYFGVGDELIFKELDYNFYNFFVIREKVLTWKKELTHMSNVISENKKYMTFKSNPSELIFIDLPRSYGDW